MWGLYEFESEEGIPAIKEYNFGAVVDFNSMIPQWTLCFKEYDREGGRK